MARGERRRRGPGTFASIMASDTASAGEAKGEWVDVGPISDLPEGKAVLRKQGGRRFACVRAGDDVHAIDDRCPHEGYPLSQGDVSGGVLTCAWHNWKFDLASGACTFGGEPVKRYPARVKDGRLHLDVSVDVEAERARFSAGICAAQLDAATAQALREALRLGAVAPAKEDGGLGALAPGFEVLVADGAARAEWGFDHGLAMTADAMSWASRGRVTAEEAFVLSAQAISEPSRRLRARARLDIATIDGPLDPSRLLDALVHERREEAEARARFIAEEQGGDAAVRALLPFVARHIYDYGHGLIYLSKARELAARFPSVRGAVFAASALELAWATADSSLPPFAATRAALARLDALGEIEPRGGAWDRAGFEAAVLEGERPGADATVDLVAGGASAVDVLRAIAHAAAVRLSRFDFAWELRKDAAVGPLDVTHTVTFAEAAIALSPLAAPRELGRLAVLAAGFVGKVRKADRAHGDEGCDLLAIAGADLKTALARRDANAAVAAVRGLDRAARARTFADVAPFCALDAAVRPIRYAHAIKNCEALARLDAGDAAGDSAYLEALVSFVAPVHVENPARRTAFVARKFLEDGRPPEGLY